MKGMHRRAALLTVLALSLSASIAHADLVPSPPPLLTIRGQDSMVTTNTGAPTHAFFTLHNGGSVPVQVRIEALVCLLPNMRLPLTVRAVLVDSRDAGRTIAVAPGQDVPIEVLFDGLSEEAARGSSWSFELRADVRGERDGRVHATSTVRRGIRHPIRHAR
ncbi:hypothetical protein [Sandaracinus amylolyticus]|uniref:DUF1573 domain-containing protein n=1 Tax=Sandaracinus amylolyticus TaxID=927083 RepID=A0A0F6VZM3_9BACT|nr:hypothetical protein [Sandaracinus amylolyticus]AKF03700.1 hypothetical protein DB32_000849 [Sandaracinus amylolyticus]